MWTSPRKFGLPQLRLLSTWAVSRIFAQKFHVCRVGVDPNFTRENHENVVAEISEVTRGMTEWEIAAHGSSVPERALKIAKTNNGEAPKHMKLVDSLTTKHA